MLSYTQAAPTELDGGEGYSWNLQWEVGALEAGIYDFKHDPDGEIEIEFGMYKNDNF